MMYSLYQAQLDLLAPLRLAADTATTLLGLPLPPQLPGRLATRSLGAAAELVARSTTTHRRPPFAIGAVEVGNRMVAVTEEVAAVTPFATLLRFRKDIAIAHPKLLVVAPMSGHFATLLRGTVRTLVPEHDVYVTDWHNARDVPRAAGEFDFDAFIAHVIHFLEVLGTGSHVLAVCQPTVAVLAAVALMAADGNRAQPRSMTLMAGPIDTRLAPTRVNELAKAHSVDWFARHLISTVPARFPGAHRRVYPGFVQLAAFMSMNLDRHARAQIDQFANLIRGEADKTSQHRSFYDEYFAVMDLHASFYLQTVQRVFQDHDLPLGRLTWRGRQVDPGRIRRTALLTVEGELDDICAIGQTMAALDLCTGLPNTMRRHHLQTGVGHYGVFNGKRWIRGIYPQVREMIQSTS